MEPQMMQLHMLKFHFANNEFSAKFKPSSCKISENNIIWFTNLLTPLRAMIFTRSADQLDLMLSWILLTSLMYQNKVHKEVSNQYTDLRFIAFHNNEQH